MTAAGVTTMDAVTLAEQRLKRALALGDGHANEIAHAERALAHARAQVAEEALRLADRERLQGEITRERSIAADKAKRAAQDEAERKVCEALALTTTIKIGGIVVAIGTHQRDHVIRQHAEEAVKRVWIIGRRAMEKARGAARRGESLDAIVAAVNAQVVKDVAWETSDAMRVGVTVEVTRT